MRVIQIEEGESVTVEFAGKRIELSASIVREADVQRAPGPHSEWPKLTVRGNGHFYDDMEGESHDIDGLDLWLESGR
jgi:hypothetical protein